MLAMYPEGNIQALAAIKRLTGISVRLMTMDEITEIESIDEGIRVWITTWRMEERRTDVKVTARGIRLVTITSRNAGIWKMSAITAWDAEQVMEEMMNAIRRQDMVGAQTWQLVSDRLGDEPFKPFFMNHYGAGKTVSEWADQVRRERMAGRVGTSSHPMDTYEWAEANATTDRMIKHWNR